MLDQKTLNEIKNQSRVPQSSQIIHIEIGNGFAYGDVTIGSMGNKQVIKELSDELGWTFRSVGMMCRTGEEFKDGQTAISIASIIKAALESKGFRVASETTAYK